MSCSVQHVIFKTIAVIVVSLSISGCGYVVPKNAPMLTNVSVVNSRAAREANFVDLDSVREITKEEFILILFDIDRDHDEWRDAAGVGQLIEVSPCIRGRVAPLRLLDVIFASRFFKSRQPPVAEGAHRYATIIDVVSKPPNNYFTTKQDRAWIGHDLRTQTDDLCLRVSGGNAYFQRYESNTLVIPYPMIRYALDQGGL